MNMKIGIACVSMLMLLTLMGCSNGGWWLAGAVISNMPTIMKIADRADSRVLKLERNSAGEVQVSGRGVHPDKGPTLDKLDLSVRDVQFQRTPFHITKIGSTTFTAQALAKDINTFVNQRVNTGKVEVREIHLAFTPQQAQLTATIVRNHRTLHVESTGTLQADGTRVAYVPQTFTTEHATLPANEQRDILAGVNPVIELHGLPCTPTITQVTLGNGTATLSGSMALKNLP